MSAPAHEVAFVGDVHLERDDPEIGPFIAFLERLGRRSRRIVLLGDLFDLWIARAELERPHHRAVVECLRGLRGRGIGVRYVEGNRDYGVAAHAGTAFDDVATGVLVERCDGASVYVVHGDLVNAADRQYRAWRAFSRSRPVWAAFNALPAGVRLALARRLERHMRGTNVEFRREFPEAAVRAYARPLLERGHSAVVLGHFHVERELVEPGGRIWVLPEWKGTRRYLAGDRGSALGFTALDEA